MNKNVERLSTSSMSGREITSLMRKNRVKIRDLAKRMSITLKRIRQVREVGLTDPTSIRDWVQAITGTDPGPIGMHSVHTQPPLAKPDQE